MDKARRTSIIFGVIFSILALGFAALFITSVAAKYLSPYMTLTLMIYFVSLAFLFTGGYNRAAGNKRSKRFFFLIGILAMTASLIMLGIGLGKGWIDLLNWPF